MQKFYFFKMKNFQVKQIELSKKKLKNKKKLIKILQNFILKKEE